MPTINQLVNKKIRTGKKKKKKVTAFFGCPHRKALCIKLYTTSPKKPNSAVRKVAKVVIKGIGKFKNQNKSVIAYIPGQGHKIQKFAWVLLRGGRVQDLPGVQYKMIRGKFDFAASESFLRKARRSKFGIKRVNSTSILKGK